MGRSAQKPTDARKYSSALYCVAWPFPEYAIVGGGGGKKTHGIPNKIALISTSGDRAGEEVSSLSTSDVPYRMALAPDGRTLLVGFEPAGLMWVNLELHQGIPTLVPRTGAIASKLKQVGAVHCMAFSSDGRFLALSRPDAPIDVYEFPAFTHRVVCWQDKPASLEIRQLCFSPAHGNRLLATVDDDGACILWHWEQQTPLVTLRVGDAGFKQGRFNRCCFGGLHDRRMYTSLNSMGCGWVVVWQQTPAGEIQFVRKVKVCTDALASFEISPHGQFLAVGTTEGEVSVYDRNFRRLVRRGGQHTWIVTSIVWAQDSHAMLSIGGDASALVTPVRAGGSSSTATLLVVLLALLLVLAAVTLQVLQPELLAHAAVRLSGQR